MNQEISFLLPDGNPRKIITNDEQIYYRNIAKQLKLTCPEEFVGVYDLKSEKVISKFNHKLESNITYKLFYMQQAIGIIQNKEKEIIQQIEENKKLKQQINDIKSKSDQDIKNLQVIQNQSDIQNNQLKMEVETKLQEAQNKVNEQSKDLEIAQNKIKEQIKDLESARYDLKIANSQQVVWKQDMERKISQKDSEIQELTSQCVKNVNDIQVLLNQLQQERVSYYQNSESLNNQLQQTANSLQQWQQYTKQLEFEKNRLDQENLELKSRNQDVENDIKKQKKKFEQQEQNNQQEIEQLEKGKSNLEIQIKRIKQDAMETENKYKGESLNQQRQLEDKQNEIISLKDNLDRCNQKLKLQMSKYQQLNDEIERESQLQLNSGQVKADEIQKLQRQIQQEKEQNEKLTEENEVLQRKVTDTSQSLNNYKSQITDLKYRAENLEEKLKTIQDESKQDLNQKQVKIEELKKEIQDLLNKKEQELKELINKHEEENEQSKNKLKNSDNEIERLKEELKKVMDEKKKIEEESVRQRQNLQKQISDQDQLMFQKEQELVAIQNSAIVPVYQFRIQRLVEQVPREYNKDIEFAIETMMLEKLNPETFLKTNQEKCMQSDFKLCQVQLNKGKSETTLYNLSDQDYRQCATVVNIGNITGIQCFVPVNSSDQSLDRYFIFKCLKCPDRKQLEGKFFGIKQCKKQDNEELEVKETAIDNCLSTIIAQDFMRKFIQELNEKNLKPNFDFKFRDQYIIETKKDFKQFLQEQIKGQQLVLQNEGIKNYVEFIEALDNDQSNEFYDFTREYQLDKKQPKDGNIIQAFLQVHNTQKLQDIYKKFNPENIRKQLNHFVDFIGGNIREMPQKLYYSIQQIEIQPDFQKYNGGHLKFESNPEGKFLSAFTYYSIVRSQRQLCISHLQGVKNQLYDPMVSTYDGFLDKMDQGYNEIRTIESKFLSESNVNKGIEYLKALGIKWS